jgi:hypothetical protein
MTLTKITSVAVILWVVLAVLPAAADTSFTSMSTWHLPGTPSEERWLEVHQIEGSGASTLFHISVLSREKGQPVWSLKHVLPHMAITEAALRRSVTGPAAKERMSYPEQYDEGYSQWRKLRAQGNAPICETSVLECAHLSP